MGCFSPFPHGTGSLSVSHEYLALADGPAGFTQGFTCPALLRIPLGTSMASRKGLSPAAARLSRRFRSPYVFHIVVLQPPHCRNRAGLGSSPVARRYWGNHSYFLFLRLLRCFSSPRSPSSYKEYHVRGGLSHSEIRGSKVICTYPRLFAAYHVLHRLWEPRHPPYALFHLYRITSVIANKYELYRGIGVALRLARISDDCHLYNFVQHVIDR